MAATHPRGVGVAAVGLAVRGSAGRQDDAGEDAGRCDVPELRPALGATSVGRSRAVLRGLAGWGHGDLRRSASSAGSQRRAENRHGRVPEPPGAGHRFFHARRHAQVSGFVDRAEGDGASVPGAVARVRGFRRARIGQALAPRRLAGAAAGGGKKPGVLRRMAGQLLRPGHLGVVRRAQSRGLPDAVPAAAATQRRPAGHRRSCFPCRGEPTDREGARGGAAGRRRRPSAAPVPRPRKQAGDRQPPQVLRLRHRLRHPRAGVGDHPRRRPRLALGASGAGRPADALRGTRRALLAGQGPPRDRFRGSSPGKAAWTLSSAR